MAKLILAIAAAYLLWYGWRQSGRLRRLPPERRRALLWRGFCVALFVVALALVLTGRAHWITAALA
ncbi:MAG: molecular chaperone DnaJ, partial [Pseudomonadota bacterium]